MEIIHTSHINFKELFYKTIKNKRRNSIGYNIEFFKEIDIFYEKVKNNKNFFFIYTTSKDIDTSFNYKGYLVEKFNLFSITEKAHIYFECKHTSKVKWTDCCILLYLYYDTITGYNHIHYIGSPCIDRKLKIMLRKSKINSLQNSFV